MIRKAESQSMLADQLQAAGYHRMQPQKFLEPDYLTALATFCECCGHRMWLFEPFLHPDTKQHRIVIRCVNCRYTTEI